VFCYIVYCAWQFIVCITNTVVTGTQHLDLILTMTVSCHSFIHQYYLHNETFYYLKSAGKKTNAEIGFSWILFTFFCKTYKNYWTYKAPWQISV